MEIISPYLRLARDHLDWAITTTEREFNQFASQIDFMIFCIVYTFVIVWVLRKFNKPEPTFRPTNKEITDWKTQLKKTLTRSFLNLPIVNQIVKSKFDKEVATASDSFYKSLEKSRDPSKSNRLPEDGMKPSNLESKVTRWFETEEKSMFSGKLSGAIYPDDAEHCK